MQRQTPQATLISNILSMLGGEHIIAGGTDEKLGSILAVFGQNRRFQVWGGGSIQNFSDPLA